MATVTPSRSFRARPTLGGRAAALIFLLACLVFASKAAANKCAKCNVPLVQGGCKCDINCDCRPGLGGSKCDKCNIAVSAGGCKCDRNCDCVGGSSGGGSGGGGTSGGTLGGGCVDAQATLVSHNNYRAWHGAGALQWSNDLANAAQSWAQTLASRGCGLQHASTGENLYMIRGGAGRFGTSDARCAAAVKSWYDEVGAYRFTSRPYTDNRANFAAIGHFTQVVWKGSTRLGCGAALGSDRSCYVVVCRYAPAGNVADDASFLANVTPRR